MDLKGFLEILVGFLKGLVYPFEKQTLKVVTSILKVGRGSNVSSTAKSSEEFYVNLGIKVTFFLLGKQRLTIALETELSPVEAVFEWFASQGANLAKLSLGKIFQELGRVWYLPAAVKKGEALVVLDPIAKHLPRFVLIRGKMIKTEIFLQEFVGKGTSTGQRITLFREAIKLIALGNGRPGFQDHTVRAFGKVPPSLHWQGSYAMIPVGGEKLKFRTGLSKVARDAGLGEGSYEFILVDRRSSTWQTWLRFVPPIRWPKEAGQFTRQFSLDTVGSIGLAHCGKTAVLSGSIAGVELDYERTCIVIDETPLMEPRQLDLVVERTVEANRPDDLTVELDFKDQRGYRRIIWRFPVVDQGEMKDEDVEEDGSVQDPEEDGQKVYDCPPWIRIQELVDKKVARSAMLPARNGKGLRWTWTIEFTFRLLVSPSKIAPGKVVIIDGRRWEHPDLKKLRDMGVRVVLGSKHTPLLGHAFHQWKATKVTEESFQGVILEDCVLARIVEPQMQGLGLINDGQFTKQAMPPASRRLLDHLNVLIKDSQVVRGKFLLRMGEILLGSNQFPVKMAPRLVRWLKSQGCPRASETLRDLLIDTEEKLLKNGKPNHLSTALNYLSSVRLRDKSDEERREGSSGRYTRAVNRILHRTIGRSGPSARVLGFSDPDISRMREILDNHPIWDISGAENVIVYFVRGNIGSCQTGNWYAMKKSPRFQGYIMLAYYQHDMTLDEGHVMLDGAMDQNGDLHEFVADATDNDGDFIVLAPLSWSEVEEHMEAFYNPHARKLSIRRKTADEIYEGLKSAAYPDDQSTANQMEFAHKLLWFAEGHGKESLGVRLAIATLKYLIGPEVDADLTTACHLVQPIFNIGFCSMIKTPEGMEIIEKILGKVDTKDEAYLIQQISYELKYGEEPDWAKIWDRLQH